MEEITTPQKHVLSTTIDADDITKQISDDFGIEFNGTSTFIPHVKYDHEKEFGIGLIVGTSGGGKTTLLKEYNDPEEFVWDNTKSIASHFSTYNEAKEAFMGVGLNSVPVWLKPYSVLSNGERYRAAMAATIKDGAVFDEFTSILDRPTAKSMALSISKYVKQKELKNIVFASPHHDITEYLEPDWVYDVDLKQITLKDSLRGREDITIKFRKNEKSLWGLFSKHHYLSHTFNKSANVYTAYWDDVLVGMVAVLTLPSGTLKNAFRFHRLVVLPEYQGLGIGMAISNAIGQLYISEGKRIYGKTAHPKVGMYREKSDKWKPSSNNLTRRTQNQADNNGRDWVVIYDKLSYAHEYIGNVDITLLEEEKPETLEEW